MVSGHGGENLRIGDDVYTVSFPNRSRGHLLRKEETNAVCTRTIYTIRVAFRRYCRPPFSLAEFTVERKNNKKIKPPRDAEYRIERGEPGTRRVYTF